ncbi:MAG: dockerin type I domain-containing protein [Clostridiales bacterium]|nr:dockerin type I domain-containing protein [Clostridiales bacterium]
MKKRLKSILALIISVTICFSSVYFCFAEETISNDDATVQDSDFLLGDVNGDGSVTAADARLAIRFAGKLDYLTEEQQTAADYDGDGAVKISDARKILRVSAFLDPYGKDSPLVAITTETTTAEPVTETTTAAKSTERTYSYEPSNLFSVSYAQYAVLYDYDNDVILYGKNMHSPCHPASTTKLITACLGCEYLSADYVLTVGSEQYLVETNTSRAGIYIGQKIKFSEILKCLLVPSGCDAAYTIAVTVARVASGNSNMSASSALSYFVNMMNEYAAKLGMNDSHFANPDGFPNSNHYVSAYDMMIIGTKAYSFSLIRNVVNQPYATAYFVSGGSKTYTNSNELINPNSSRYYQYAVGIKTGSHSQAGQCLVCAAVKYIDNTGKYKTFIAVVMNCPSKAARYTDLKSLFNTGFSYFWR